VLLLPTTSVCSLVLVPSKLQCSAIWDIADNEAVSYRAFPPEFSSSSRSRSLVVFFCYENSFSGLPWSVSCVDELQWDLITIRKTIIVTNLPPIL
jgi:hypothetical protein